MKEAEVSLRVALYYIKNRSTEDDVQVFIDGAHIKTKEQVHFNIQKFLKEYNCVKVDNNIERWQGIYEVKGYKSKIIVQSTPGCGDVIVNLKDGKQLYIESKKGKNDKSSSEYSLMREAIGQLMTGCVLTDNMVPCVAVPYTGKSMELAKRWSGLRQMKVIGIKFLLVKDDCDLYVIG